MDSGREGDGEREEDKKELRTIGNLCSRDKRRIRIWIK